MPVTLHDLRRDGLGFETETLAGEAHALGGGGCGSADAARKLPDAHALEGIPEPLAAAAELERPAGELETEGGRLGVDSMRAADADVVLVLHCARDHGLERVLQTREQHRPGLTHLQRKRGVDDV